MYILQSAIVLILVAISGAISFMALRQVVASIRSGSAEQLPSRLRDRILSVIIYVFGQKKVLEDRKYGFMHYWYLYGFLILGIGHLELVLFGLSRFVKTWGYEPILYRNISFLPDWLVHIYEFSQDIMAAMVVIIVAVALYFRLSGKVERLKPRSRDAETILWLIGALYVTFFLYVPTETLLRMQEGQLAWGWHWFLPFSSIKAMNLNWIFAPSPETTAVMNNIAFFMHLGVFLFFACYIPRSKHMHLLAAGPNIYFRHFDAVAKPRPIDFEKSEKFGVDQVQELSWKSLLDTFACTECGRCNAVCPANLTLKPLQPKKILHDIKQNLREGIHHDPALPLVNRTPGEYTSDGQIHLDELWACTTCAACVEVCPVLIDSVPTSIIEMRRNFVMMEASDYPKELNAAFKGLENQGNPWGVGQNKRLDWAQGLDVPIMAEQGGREVEYLYWVGCAGATDDRGKKIQQALVRILKQAKVDFAILGCEEKCTGDPARRMGHEYIFDSLAKENVETLAKYKFRKIFTACPHCFNALGKEYGEYGADYSVQHHTELIQELIKDGRISFDPEKSPEKTVTFHDPCYLGRYNQKYEEPRDVLGALPNVKSTEMVMNKQKSFCCGAGGGRMFMEEHIGKRINHERTDQALATGATAIATGCPFCMTMLTDAVKDKGIEDTVQVKDIAEMVAERMM